MWTDAGGHVDYCFPKCWSLFDSQEAESRIQDQVLRSDTAGFYLGQARRTLGGPVPVCRMELPMIILTPKAGVRLKRDNALKPGI